MQLSFLRNIANQYFLRSVSQGNRNKSKNRQMTPILKMKWQPMDCEKIFAKDVTGKGLTSKT